MRVIAEGSDSTTEAIAESFRLTKFLLSELFVKGPEGNMEDYRREVDSLTNLAAKLETDLARRSVSFKKSRSYSQVSSKLIASLIPQNSVLVEYVKFDLFNSAANSSEPHYLVAVVDKSGPRMIKDLGAASIIDSSIEKYRKNVMRSSALTSQLIGEYDLEEYYRLKLRSPGRPASNAPGSPARFRA